MSFDVDKRLPQLAQVSDHRPRASGPLFARGRSTGRDTLGQETRVDPALGNGCKIFDQFIYYRNTFADGQFHPCIFMRSQSLYGAIHRVVAGRRHTSRNRRKLGGTAAGGNTHGFIPPRAM